MSLELKKHWLIGTIPFIVILTLWCLLSYGKIVRPLFLPTPTVVVTGLFELFSKEQFHKDILFSLSRVITGFGISAIFAIPVGLLMGSSKKMEALLLPIVGFLRYMPATAFIPLAILWFGVGFVQSIVLVFISVAFYLALMIADASSNVSKALIETAQTLGASRSQIVMSVIFRSALPDILNAMRTMFGVVWVMIVVIELVGAEYGIGAKIIHAQRFLQTPKVLAGIGVIGVLGIGSDLIFRGIRRAMFPWASK